MEHKGTLKTAAWMISRQAQNMCRNCEYRTGGEEKVVFERDAEREWGKRGREINKRVICNTGGRTK